MYYVFITQFNFRFVTYELKFFFLLCESIYPIYIYIRFWWKFPAYSPTFPRYLNTLHTGITHFVKKSCVQTGWRSYCSVYDVLYDPRSPSTVRSRPVLVNLRSRWRNYVRDGFATNKTTDRTKTIAKQGWESDRTRSEGGMKKSRRQLTTPAYGPGGTHAVLLCFTHALALLCHSVMLSSIFFPFPFYALFFSFPRLFFGR